MAKPQNIDKTGGLKDLPVSGCERPTCESDRRRTDFVKTEAGWYFSSVQSSQSASQIGPFASRFEAEVEAAIAQFDQGGVFFGKVVS